jgi:molybdate transport system permease protein
MTATDRGRPSTRAPLRGRSRPPIVAVALASVAVLFFALPLLGIVIRAPWGSVWGIVSATEVRQAVWLSLKCSLTATMLSFLFGVPLAWVLARASFPGRRAVRALCTMSMVLPPVVGGVALFFSLGRTGLIGQYLYSWFGFMLPFTTWGVIVAQTFVAMPFLVLTVEAALRQFDSRLDDAARTLGGSPWYVFRRVTLPSIRPALVAEEQDDGLGVVVNIIAALAHCNLAHVIRLLHSWAIIV